MGYKQNYQDKVTILASEADWAWPKALSDIFRPRGVDLLVARNPDEFINIINHERIFVTIIDVERPNGFSTVKIIRINYPFIPCILLTSSPQESLLNEALRLDVFSVIDKPVNMDLLRQQLHRLFVKKYNSNIFNR